MDNRLNFVAKPLNYDAEKTIVEVETAIERFPYVLQENIRKEVTSIL